MQASVYQNCVVVTYMSFERKAAAVHRLGRVRALMSLLGSTEASMTYQKAGDVGFSHMVHPVPNKILVVPVGPCHHHHIIRICHAGDGCPVTADTAPLRYSHCRCLGHTRVNTARPCIRALRCPLCEVVVAGVASPVVWQAARSLAGRRSRLLGRMQQGVAQGCDLVHDAGICAEEGVLQQPLLCVGWSVDVVCRRQPQGRAKGT